MTCKNRIKPKLLRDVKTEALLVFIRTTLEQSFYQIDNIGYSFELGNDKDKELVYSSLKKLLEQLQDTVINSTYLRSLIENSHKNATLKLLAKKEEPLMIYYDTLIKTIEVCLPNGSSWIPELVVISLLSEWIIEEEKTAYLELKIEKIYQQLDKQLSAELVKPLQSHLEQCFQKFNTKLEEDLFYINLQIEELINELQSAFDAEQLPYEQKKKRKDIMKDIDNRNKSIQIEINTVKKNLPVLLAGGIL